MVEADTPDGGEDFAETLAELLEHAQQPDVSIESVRDIQADGRRWAVQITRVRDGSDD